MKPLKIAIIGLGDMGTGHVKGFSAIEDAEIVAVCDLKLENIERIKKLLNNDKLKCFTNYKKMLEEITIDAVVISVPGYLHEEILKYCLEKNKHVFLEKPTAITYESLKRVKEMQTKYDRIVQVGLVYRYSNFYRVMSKEILDKKILGNVMLAWCKEFRQCFPPEDWFYDEKKSGGTFVEKNCHHFDIFNWMIDSKPKKVFAMGGQHVYKKNSEAVIDCSYSETKAKVINDISIVDHGFVTIEYENGAKANLALCMYLKPYNLTGDGLEIGFIGDNGKQLVAKNDKEFGVYGGEYADIIEYKPDVEKDNEGYGHIGCQTQRKEFLVCIRDNVQPIVTIEETQNSLLIALAAEKSIKEGRAVDISEFE
ncbi:Gfo/Idh/MocA family protein [Clostridium sp.]